MSGLGKSCKTCNKKNHFSQCCLSKKAATIINATGCNDMLNTDTQEIKIIDNDMVNERNYGSTSLNIETPSSDWAIDLDANGTQLKFKLETGVQCNILPKSIYLKLHKKPKLHKTKISLKAYNDSTISVCGKCVLTLKYNNKTFKTLFIVVEAESSPLLGLKTWDKLNLIK